jgi:hypothetical protein
VSVRSCNLWDERYRLTNAICSVDRSVLNIEYAYDVAVRKVSCSVGSASQTNTEYCIYNGIHIVADVDASGDPLRTYTYGPGIDNIFR